MKTVEEVVSIPLTKLVPHPDNPRKPGRFAKAHIKPLSKMLEMNGVSPLVVRELDDGTFQILAGHRREAALELDGEKTAPCVVRKMDDVQALRFVLADNVGHEPADPFLEARAIKKLLDLDGATLESTATSLGWSVRTVARRRELLNLCPTLMDERQRGDTAISLWPVTWLEAVVQLDPVVQEKWFAECAPDLFTTIDELEGSIAGYLRDLGKAPWDLNDEKLVPKAGACVNCPKQSSFVPGLFGNEGEKVQGATCRDAVCFKAKADKFAGQKIRATLEKSPDIVCLRGAMPYSHDPSEKLSNVSARIPKGTETIGHGGWKPCAKDDKGAKRGIVISGPAAGKTQWFKKDAQRSYAPASMQPPSAKDVLKKLEADHLKAGAARFAGVAAAAVNDAKVPDHREVLALLCVVGLRAAGWKEFEEVHANAVVAAHGKKEQFAELVWPEVKTETVIFLHDDWHATPDQLRAMARKVLTILFDDTEVTAMEEASDLEVKEPQELLDARAAVKSKGKKKKETAAEHDTKGDGPDTGEPGVCRTCKCTETTPCVTDGEPCAWADITKTLCTACNGGVIE